MQQHIAKHPSHPSTMDPRVTKMAPVLVSPSKPTPSGHLPLSCLDRLPVMRYFFEMFHVYSHGHEPAEVVRSALAKALVPYYPVAGRISISGGDGELQVSCTGEGVWFVAASAACSLEDVGYVEGEPFGISKEQLLPLPPPGIVQDDLIFMLQVTEFECGGFVIGYVINHAFFDGTGVGQFILAIGEMAKGLETPTVKLAWGREAIPDTLPLGIELTHSATATPPPSHLERHTVDLSLDSVYLLASQYAKETGRRCSSFDVVSAVLWQCRTRAIDLPPHADVSLDFPMNVRKKLCKELPAEGGYYGNCICEVIIERTGTYIANAPLSEVIGLIKDAKENLSTEFSRWLEGDPHDKSPQQLVAYESLCLTDLRRVGFYEADYGWGAPDHVVPLFDYPIALCSILNSPPPMKGVRVLAQCVAKEHLQAFCDRIKELATLY